jgi:hypothetical protein
MAEKKTAAKMPVKRAVAATRKSTDKRTVGTPTNPKKVAAPKAYKPPVVPNTLNKKSAGRPKKAQ